MESWHKFCWASIAVPSLAHLADIIYGNQKKGISSQIRIEEIYKQMNYEVVQLEGDGGVFPSTTFF